MIKYQFHQTVVLRSPVYSYQVYADYSLEQVLKQDFFRKAIYFASESFYDELQKNDFEFNRLNGKAVETLTKYFNRMCYRPTPFGLYAAVGPVKWGETSGPILFSKEKLEPKIQFSYAKSKQYADLLLASKTFNFLYKLNSTFYKVGKEYRFLKQSNDGTQVDFIIDSLEADLFFDRLTGYLVQSKSLEEIINFIIAETGCLENDAHTYVKWLIDNQVINHQYEANITGKDYLGRLLSTGSESPEGIQNLVNKLEDAKDVERLKIIPDKIISGGDSIKNSDFYVNLKIDFQNEKLAQQYQGDILDGLNCLDKLSPPDSFPSGITEFIKKFNQKFDGQTVPLLIALDPEIGVGYNDLAIPGDDINIAKNIIPGSNLSENKTISWSDAHGMLLKKWTAMDPNALSLEITDEDLTDLKFSDGPFSPSMSVMFRIVSNKVFIESAGGATATSLIGRFTPLNKHIEQLAIDLANTEINNNPNVIFAEIAHICHSHTANIDRRSHIYPYEIPILLQSTLSQENQIPLSDLWVSVINGNIILQSQKHRKRVVPRLSSAFNYARNDLAIFRFLCDMQSTDIKTRFNFNLSQFFPGMGFYPRVEYKNTILQHAYWNITKDVFDTVFKAINHDKISAFKIVKQQLKLPQYIAVTQSDHQLVFNLDKTEEVSFFLENIKGMQQIKLAEYFFPDIDKPVIIDQEGKQHVNQFITSLYHNQIVYHPLVSITKDVKKVTRKYIPGSEWLYFKIYCHPVRSNEILVNILHKKLKSFIRDKTAYQWFFIRYSDPDYHIRLRIAVNPQKHQEVLNTVYKILSKKVADGIVSNIMIDTYQRELERYLPEMIELSERVFYASSKFVISFLHKMNPLEANDIITFAVISVNDMLISSDLSAVSIIKFLENMFGSFALEFRTVENLKHQLDIEYRKQKLLIEQALTQRNDYYNSLNLSGTRELFMESLAIAINKIKMLKDAKLERWLSDIIHMHLNRIFVTDSRKQEMTIYYFILKYKNSEQARNKQLPKV